MVHHHHTHKEEKKCDLMWAVLFMLLQSSVSRHQCIHPLLCIFVIYIYIIISLIQRCQWPSHWTGTGLAWGPVRTHPLAHYAFRTGVMECPPPPPTRTCHTHTLIHLRAHARTNKPSDQAQEHKSLAHSPNTAGPFWTLHKATYFFPLSQCCTISASTTVLLLQAWPREPRFSPPYKERKVLKKGVKRTPRPLHRSCVLYCYE